MNGELNRNRYCAGLNVENNDRFDYCTQRDEEIEIEICKGCRKFHYKWPTPEQFCQEYGMEAPQGMPVWVNFDIGLNDTTWVLTQIATEFLSPDRTVYYGPVRAKKVNAIVVACTPWGKPPSGWIPE